MKKLYALLLPAFLDNGIVLMAPAFCKYSFADGGPQWAKAGRAFNNITTLSATITRSVKDNSKGARPVLSLSYDIVVKGHGGHISVDTKEGEFTEFIVILPLNREL